ncbi:unnamed protein product [Closterium sp. NIES-53]
MVKATSGWYLEVDVARQVQTIADGCTTVQVGPIICAHLRACAMLSSMGQRWTAALLQRWHTVDLLCWHVALLQCWRGSSTQRWQVVDHAVLSVDQASCRVARPAAAIVTMVDPVANASVADTLEARLANARKRHADGEYGTIPLLIVELGIRSQWATEHPSRPVSPRSVRNEGGVDEEVDSGARVSGNDGTKQRGVLKVDGVVDRSQARVQQSAATADSSHADVDGQRRSPLRSRGGLSATTHVTAGGIAPTYGYFKFSPDRITVAPLQGRRDLIT